MCNWQMRNMSKLWPVTGGPLPSCVVCHVLLRFAVLTQSDGLPVNTRCFDAFFRKVKDEVCYWVPRSIISKLTCRHSSSTIWCNCPVCFIPPTLITYEFQRKVFSRLSPLLHTFLHPNLCLKQSNQIFFFFEFFLVILLWLVSLLKEQFWTPKRNKFLSFHVKKKSSTKHLELNSNSLKLRCWWFSHS
jgi:hypothetical protein